MTDQIIRINNLKKNYGDAKVVRGISLSINKGEIFSLLGPNGAGKTTTISILSCLIKPTSGDALINSFSIVNEPMKVRQEIGVVPQELALYETLSAKQNLDFWGHMYGMQGKPLAHRIDELLEQVGLADRAKDAVKEFSGGMKRRLNIAIGLIHKPSVLFMDEPTVGIDPQSRRNILDMIKTLRSAGMTILYTTHYMEEAEELSNRISIIDQGEIIATGTQQELVALIDAGHLLTLQFESPVTDDLVGDMLQINGVSHLQPVEDKHSLVLNVSDATALLPKIIAATSAKAQIRSIDIAEPNLEAVFLHLTGRALRN